MPLTLLIFRGTTFGISLYCHTGMLFCARVSSFPICFHAPGAGHCVIMPMCPQRPAQHHRRRGRSVNAC